jgi:hypothetical protein
MTTPLPCPQPADFRHPSDLHGQHHVARVLVHALRLVEATGLSAFRTPLWAAVYLHDLERTHDGYCERHGADAWLRFTRDQALQQILALGGVTPDQHPMIRTAVTHHCRRELPGTHEHYTLTALLKDADGLDRVRLGDLDPSRLRFDESQQMVPFAEHLLQVSEGIDAGAALFPGLWAWARHTHGGRAS